MNPYDVDAKLEHWGKMGFNTHEGGDNPIKWIDICIVEVMFGGKTLPCDWLEVEGKIAYLKGKPKGEMRGRES